MPLTTVARSIAVPVRSAAGPLLTVDDIAKTVGGVRVLGGLSLTLDAGDALGIAGRGGQGQAVLLDIISGFLRPDAGRVRLGGRDLTGWAPHRIVRAGVARTFYPPRPAFGMTVREVVVAATLSRHLRPREAGDAADRSLEIAGLRVFGRRDVRTLSEAQIRCLEVARALATSPRVVLLDEPVAGLGPDEEPEVLSTLRRLRAEGVTMVVSARHRALLQAVCTRVALIEDGRIGRSGDPGVLFGA
jgi:branched-chain amino acid transport system ATP-binding protein